jgi:cystathionine gamma-synthase
MKFETLAIHAGREPDPATGAVREPIHLATTFERGADGSYPHGYFYSRSGNPNRTALERAVAALEGGHEAVAFASGTAATLAVFSLAAAGGRVVCSSDCYHGTAKQLREILPRWGGTAEFVDTTDLDAVRRTLEPGATMLWVETPSNPLLRVSDLAALAALAHERGALLGCDNTFASPVLQQPFTLGADLVMHSTTKYLGGHSDVLGGIVVVREASAELEGLRHFQGAGGGVPSPFDCWLLLRSLPTLPLRVRQQSANALAVARFLAADPRVERVHYPGLERHPGHALAARQMHGGYGAVVSFQVPGGAAETLAVTGRVRLFTRATSLGGVESLIEHRASMEGPLSQTPPNLVRMSVGLENVDDLVADLDQALSG